MCVSVVSLLWIFKLINEGRAGIQENVYLDLGVRWGGKCILLGTDCTYPNSHSSLLPCGRWHKLKSSLFNFTLKPNNDSWNLWLEVIYIYICDCWQHGTEWRKPNSHAGCFYMARSSVSCRKNKVSIRFSSLWLSCHSSWTLYFSNPILSLDTFFFLCIAVEFRWEAILKSSPHPHSPKYLEPGSVEQQLSLQMGRWGTLSQELHLCGEERGWK